MALQARDQRAADSGQPSVGLLPVPFPVVTAICPCQLALLNLSCCESRRVLGRPSLQAIWSITCKGDIFVSEPSPDLEAPEHPLPCDQM